MNSPILLRVAIRAAWLGCGSGLAACHPPRDERSQAAPDRAAASVVSAPVQDPPAPPLAKPVNAWQGRWEGACTLEKTELKLPGNQGVQIAWLKDTGKQRSGTGTLTCNVNESGAASCAWTRHTPNAASGEAPPELQGFGTWDDATRVSAELRTQPQTETATDTQPGERLTHFAGTLQAEQSAKDTLTGAVRLASGDGKTLRSGNFVLKRTPQGSP